MKHFAWIFLLLFVLLVLAGCSSGPQLTMPMAQNALNRMLSQGRFDGGTAVVTKIEKIPQNSAKATLTFEDLSYTGATDEFPQRYTGPAEATFHLSNNGTWVLIKVTAEDLSWDGLNIEAR